jgi:hypothetical protein
MNKLLWSYDRSTVFFTGISFLATIVFVVIFITSEKVWFIPPFVLFGVLTIFLNNLWTKDIRLSRWISADILRLGYTEEVKNVSTINPAKNMANFIGFILDTKYYLPYSVSGDYSVLVNAYGDNIKIYRYTLVGSKLKILAVVDSTQDPDNGGVRVYSN